MVVEAIGIFYKAAVTLVEEIVGVVTSAKVLYKFVSTNFIC